MSSFSSSGTIPATRDAAWVLRGTLTWLVFSWVAVVCGTIFYLSWVEYRLADAARHGLWEAALPKGSLSTVRREVVAELNRRHLPSRQLFLALFEDGRQTDRLTGRPGRVATLQIAVPLDDLLPLSLRRLSLLADGRTLLAGSQLVSAGHGGGRQPD